MAVRRTPMARALPRCGCSPGTANVTTLRARLALRDEFARVASADLDAMRARAERAEANCDRLRAMLRAVEDVSIARDRELTVARAYLRRELVTMIARRAKGE